ncbi:tryptophan halogenase family protein [Alteromonas halophila]|uniref:Tryptophan halogenase n=1 Tax=Alteromonas halophila TaxID=516698 RepID=A0A918JF51_9ALTE|nr:tryptophan halogenase family protein [Alteromonas halophila]GGW78125.1 tryptophan halogenase [Alteromonas halophila]
MTKAEPQTTTPVNSIVIAGGGAAGWLTAAIIAAEHNVKDNPALSVTLVESPDVRILGVGEGTWPTMRDTLRKIGIDERTFMLECDASFKQGTSFNRWHRNNAADTYYHPFDLPAGFFEADIAAWWQHHRPDAAFADLFSTQVMLCQQHRAPKQPHTPGYAAVANYGYHLDANKFADLLKRHCTENLGVRHIREHIDAIETDEADNITALVGKHQRIDGELFVDCTGFAARLIGQHYGIEQTPVEQSLCNNCALAVQAPYVSDEVPIASATLSTAQSCGWIWDIGLPHRKGVGYVHSAAHCDTDEAAKTLLAYLNADEKTASVREDAIREIRFTPGYRQKTWVNNCVAVGTSAGFFEPLEASALVMIELSASHIARQLPSTMTAMAATSRHFNQVFNAKWQRIIDFLKLHYVLSRREDSQYWRDMRDLSSASLQLQDWLTQWRERPASLNDFMYNDEIFPLASYQYILYGMQFTGTLRQPASRTDAQTEHFLKLNEQRKQQQRSGLPENRAFINALHNGEALTIR